MTTISASMVKELRQRTGVGMMECKRALQDANGDMEQAIEALRAAGQAKAVKKAGRIAAEGIVAVAAGKTKVALVEVNSETDFVAKDAKLQSFAQDLAQLALDAGVSEVTELAEKQLAGKTVEATRLELITTLGENISIRRVHYYSNAQGSVGVYTHTVGGVARIAAYVALDKQEPDLARDLAMHVAAMKPDYISANDVPEARLEAEKKVLKEQTLNQNSGKPEEIISKILQGKVNKFVEGITLLGQFFVKDDKSKVAAVLKAAKTNVVAMQRFEVGEGIEKKEEDFASAVMAEINKR